jgi:ubiquinone/menaquinone biosynthesis C-methylase UbiE
LKSRGFGYRHPERRKWQNPESILKQIGLKPRCTLIDIGCGEGFFALPAAGIVGPDGKVFALDINTEAIATLKREADKRKLTNLIAVTGKAEEAILCRSCADFVFFGIVLHDFDDPHRVLANSKIMMKPQGCLADLDWKKEPMDFGPPLEKKFSETEATMLIESEGFKVARTRSMQPYSYIITATLPTPSA